MTDAFDEELADKFRKRMFQTFSGGIVTLQVDLAVRTGLLETLAAGAGTSKDLAERRACRSATSGSALAPWSPPTSSTTTPRHGPTPCPPSTRPCSPAAAPGMWRRSRA